MRGRASWNLPVAVSALRLQTSGRLITGRHDWQSKSYRVVRYLRGKTKEEGRDFFEDQFGLFAMRRMTDAGEPYQLHLRGERTQRICLTAGGVLIELALNHENGTMNWWKMLFEREREQAVRFSNAEPRE